MAEVAQAEGSASYHRNVNMAFIFTVLYSVGFSVALGPLFDVYLYQLGGGNTTYAGDGNTLVGKVESVSGLVALALVIPVGFIVDTWDRVVLMRLAAVCGLLCSAVGGLAIWASEDKTVAVYLWYATMAASGVYSQLSNSVVYALFADSVVSEQRTRATSTMGILTNIAMAAGPGLTFFSMLYLGNDWTMDGLKIVLSIGFLVLQPISCVICFFFQKAPYQQESGGDAEAGENEADANSKYLKIKGAGCVPWLACTSDFITCIGAGMTIKYFNLYWKNDYQMNPTEVLAIGAFQPLGVAFFIKLLEVPSRLMGRAQASLICFLVGAFAFVVLAKVQNLPIALTFYFVRSGMANAVYPLNKSIMFDFTPSEQRGRWNAAETLSGSVWSGSAFMGGYLADQYGYRFTFLLTGGIYVFACLIYSPLLCIVPRKFDEKQEPLLASPGGRKVASPVQPYGSPAMRAALMFSPGTQKSKDI